MSSGADVSLTTPNFSLNGGPLAADLNGDGADDLLLSAANQSAPGGARSLAGQADIVFGDPHPAVFSLGIGAMQYELEAPFLHISHVAVEADHVVLDANAAGGVTPTLWRSPDLRRWSPVPGFQVLTTNSTLRLTDPAPNLSAGPALYQIRW